MKVKRYLVDSLPQALNQIKLELGQDAIILHTKKVKQGGFLGFFGREKVEVIAAIDQINENNNNHSKHKAERVNNEKNNIVVLNNDKSTENISKEVSELKNLMIKMMLNNSETNNHNPYSQEIKNIYERLKQQGVREEVVSEIIENILKITGNNLDDINIVDEVKKYLIDKFSSKKADKQISPNTKIVHFVGPTGVGKTTTIAKLAAEQVLKHNKRIAFITADTYRIAAIEQLKTYTEILNSPLEVVFSPQDTQRALEKLKDFDLIFMDTAGRNYHNDMHISELNNILAKSGGSETFLVLSLTQKFEDMVSILEQFKKINIDKILFTKFDETLSYGAVLNIISMFPYKLSYVTIGQNVPDDIEVFNEEKIAKAILGA